MTTAWVVPLVVSGGVGLVATPLARRLALQAGLVDRPGPHKLHRRTTPYLGGMAIALAVIVGRLAKPTTKEEATVLGLAAGLAVMGLIDDERTLPALPRLGIEAACAVVAVLAGVQISGTGLPWLDVAVTVALLVGVTNATNLMDNLDGLAAGVTAAGAAGVGILAGLGGDNGTSADAATLVGACLAFLVFNARPASIFMGDAGSLFLGFLLAAVAIQAGGPLPAPANFAVPLLIVALPLTDTVTVVVGRLRHGRSPVQGGRDHLSHRLAGTGIGPGPAVAVLTGVECLMSALAILAARGRLPVGTAVVGACAILLALLMVTARVRVYPKDAVALPRVLVWGGAAALIVVVVLAIPAALGMLRAHRPALAGEVAVQNALAAARGGHLSTLTADLAVAKADFAEARRDLYWPLASAGLAYPVLSSNLNAARTIVTTGLSLSQLGGQLDSVRSNLDLQVHDGTVALQPLIQVAPNLRTAAATVSRASTRVSHLSQAYLLPPVARALDQLERALGPAQQDLNTAAGAAANLPDMLGLNGPRRYFLAVQNLGESRATGGLIGNWGILLADHGHLQVQSFSRLEQLVAPENETRTLAAPPAYLARYQEFDPAHDWQNINMSPDFPTVGSVIANLFPQSSGFPIDGVIAVDPVALQALLELTGPIQVAGWPASIGPGNVLPVIEQDEYITYPDETQRASFLGTVAQSAFNAFDQLNLSDLTSLISVLGPAVHEGDVQVYSTRPAQESYLKEVGLAGAFPPVQSASLGITTQNVAANKIDYYLHRSLDYRVTLSPQTSGGAVATSAQASTDLTVELQNRAPASGLPPSIIGPYLPTFQSGEDATYLSIYSPLAFGSATLNGAPTPLSSGTELGRNVYATFVDTKAGQTTAVGISLAGQTALLPGGWYQLDLPHQTFANPDQVRVQVTVGDGWRVSGVRGGTRLDPHTVAANFSQSADRSVWVQVAKDGG